MSLYDYILKTGNIKKYLCNNDKIQTAIGNYNPYVQTLEFIFYGIKFIFKMTSNEYSNEIKLNEFDNYEVFIIDDYNGTDTNEIIISKKEEFILIINHVYKSGYFYSNSNIKMYKNNLMQDATYNYYKTPFTYNLIDSAYINNNLYINKSTAYTLNDIENISAFIELDLDKYNGDFVNFNEEPSFAYFTIDDTFKNMQNYDIYDSINKSYILSNGEISSSYDKFVEKYGNANIDFRDKNGYIIKTTNVDPNEVLALPDKEKLQQYIKSFNSNYDIYIIEKQSDGTIPEPIKINNNYKPLTIDILIPNRVKYNNGLFNPNFIDIFNFELNDPISEILNIDTLYGNTLISSIDSIKNYYNNKVLDNYANYTYNYFIDEYKSPFSTNWDNNIYRTYSNETDYQQLNGYVIGIDDKMMFGSKVINLHNDGITLRKWNYVNNINNATFNISKFNEHSAAKNVLEISLNLTKTFYQYLFNTQSFIDNWKSINE